jgi:tetratricopeptide (TPR) repeat protein
MGRPNPKSRRRPAVAVFVVACLAISMPMAPARAQRPTAERVLQGVSSRKVSGGWEILVRFGHSLRYVRYAPRAKADFVIVELEPVGLGAAGQPLRGLESIRNDSKPGGAPASEVLLRAGARGTQSLEIRFLKDVEFEVKQEQDLTSLTVFVRGNHSSTGDARAVALMERGEEAMAAGDYDQAIQIYTKVLSMSAPGLHPQALEFLGLAREKNGQTAHARAEYQKYLERYPDGEGATRVAQRLQSLMTIGADIPEPLRAARNEEPSAELRYDVNGSAALHYSRAEVFLDGFDDQVLDSSQITDVYLNGRILSPGFEVEATVDARQRYDFNGGSMGDDARINSLLVEYSERGPGFWGNVGRQRGSGGVLGRFDGGRVGYRPVDSVDFSILGGFPLDTNRSDDINTNRYQIGMVTSVLEIADLFDAELYANIQREDDLFYRAAIGGEFRHLRPGRSLVAAFDYDVHFGSLNLAMLIADVQIDPKLSLNTHLEYRNSPFLTLGSALIGQGADSISSLRNSFSSSAMRDLAEDRTATSTTFNVGATYRFTDAYEVMGSWTATELSGTDTSGGVIGQQSTGFEFSYFAQLVAYELLQPRGVSTVGLAVFDGDRYNRYALQLNGRYVIFPKLRINPIVRLELQDVDGNDDLLTFVPRIRIDYTLGPVVLDVDFAYELRRNLGSGLRPDEHGYSLYTGIRFDF